MAELTLEALAAKIDAQDKIITGLQEEVKIVNEKREELLKVIGNASNISTQAAIVHIPTIPKDNLKVGTKEYKFTVAAFHLAGQAEPNTAEQAMNDKELVKKILAINGQTILKEQV